MKKLFILTLLILSTLSSNLFAEDLSARGTTIINKESKIASKDAALSGRIVDQNKEVLPGAVINIPELSMYAITDVHGYFYLSNIPVGKHSVTVSYTGYEPYNVEIEFKASTVTDVDIAVSAGIELEAIVVSGIVSGRAKAVQQQRSEVGVSNVISANQIERFPDENIGDALKRIPGINVQYDQGEARFGQVRGTAPDLSSVTVNGNRTPSAEGSTRAAQLDLIPADMIQSVEVRKVITSDMDGDAIGGAVNLVTKSAPTRNVFNTSLSTSYNPIAEKMSLNGALTVGGRFANGKLGIIGAISYSNNPIGSDNIEAEWTQDDDNNPYIEEFQVRQYYVHRERQSYSLSMDYEFSPNHKIEVKGLFNRRNDWENRYRLSLKDLSAPDENGVVEAGKVRRQTKGGGADAKYTRLEQQQTQSYNIAGEHRFSRLEFDWNVDYSTAYEKRPDERYIGFEEKGMDLIANYGDGYAPEFTPIDANDMLLNSENFNKLDELVQSYQDIQEHEIKATAAFKLDMKKGKYANTLRFGYKLQSKTKSMELTYYDIDPTDKDSFIADSKNYISDQSRSNYLAGNYMIGSFVTREYLGDLDFTDPTKFERVNNVLEQAGGYTGREVINAGYIRFDQKIGKKLDVIAGLRYESTLLDYTGETITIPEEDVYDIEEQVSKRTINNLLPSVVLKYTPTKDIIVRASYTNTIARPKFKELVPGDMVDFDNMELTQGNPNLNNALSYNYDLMFEYYTPGAGIISAGLYYKDIKDFIVEANLEDYEALGYEWDQYKRSVNAGNASLFGVELAFQRDLSFISESLRNFGVYANYTYTMSSVRKLTDPLLSDRDPSELSLPGSPENIINASLYYENKYFSAAIAYNYASSFLDEVGKNSFYDRYYDSVNYLDVNLSVKASKWLTIFAEVNNILNQPLRYYQGEKNQMMQVEYYNTKGTLGIKMNF